MRTLIAIPVFNEEKHVERVLDRVARFVPTWASAVLVIDDGSTDRTPDLLANRNVHLFRHEGNLGYGRSLRDAFLWADRQKFDWVVTMDCDEQHEPDRIPAFVEAARTGDADIISGSRYMRGASAQSAPPADRRAINARLTGAINRRLGFSLTDAFCGYKAHRVDSMRSLSLDESGYAFPMQLWVQAAARKLRVREIPVSLIYNDPNRTFGGPLDDPLVRLRHYCAALESELQRWSHLLPPKSEGALAPCRECA